MWVKLPLDVRVAVRLVLGWAGRPGLPSPPSHLQTAAKRPAFLPHPVGLTQQEGAGPLPAAAQPWAMTRGWCLLLGRPGDPETAPPLPGPVWVLTSTCCCSEALSYGQQHTACSGSFPCLNGKCILGAGGGEGGGSRPRWSSGCNSLLVTWALVS